jgi:hypothetical protein
MARVDSSVGVFQPYHLARRCQGFQPLSMSLLIVQAVTKAQSAQPYGISPWTICDAKSIHSSVAQPSCSSQKSISDLHISCTPSGVQVRQMAKNTGAILCIIPQEYTFVKPHAAP